VTPESKDARRERQAIEEWQMLEVLRRAGNTIDSEVLLAPPRKWRVDHVINDEIAVEIQGFGFGHVGRAGWLRDIDKAQAIAARGWFYVPMTREQIKNGDALEALSKCGVAVEPKT
jgi:hypothetical protein